MSVTIQQCGRKGKAVPLGACTNILVREGAGNMRLKWTDPLDVVANGETTAKWAGTKLVRKTGASYPVDENDGELVIDSKDRDAFADTWYFDYPLTSGETYRYALFPYTRKTTTYDDRGRVSGVPSEGYAPALGQNTWGRIAQASKMGDAPLIWHVGDEIKLTLSGGYAAQELTFQIADFGHDDLADGSGKAGITFIRNDIADPLGADPLPAKMLIQEPSKGSNYGWPASDIFLGTLPKIFSCLPAGLQDAIKPVIKQSAVADGTGEFKGTEDSVNKLFLPSLAEVNYRVLGRHDEGTPYPVFTDAGSRSRRTDYWLRSPDQLMEGIFYTVEDSGGIGRFAIDFYRSVYFGFCI